MPVATMAIWWSVQLWDKPLLLKQGLASWGNAKLHTKLCTQNCTQSRIVLRSHTQSLGIRGDNGHVTQGHVPLHGSEKNGGQGGGLV